MARSGWSAGVACTASLHGVMAASRSACRPGALEPGLQCVPEVRQVRGAVGVVGGGGLHGLLPGLDGGVEIGTMSPWIILVVTEFTGKDRD